MSKKSKTFKVGDMIHQARLINNRDSLSVNYERWIVTKVMLDNADRPFAYLIKHDFVERYISNPPLSKKEALLKMAESYQYVFYCQQRAYNNAKKNFLAVKQHAKSLGVELCNKD